ncbi:MAG: hypothetical protein GY806_03280 [Gammaproteobacteria bacterium]|nr:hypothetical protein [Gammaproteobacteria bacterium]
MPLILRRSLIFVALLLGGLVLYSLWFGMKADRFDDTAIPYLESSIPILASWQYEQLKPLLSPAAKSDFNNEKMQEAYQLFSRLGRFESMERPRYSKNHSDTSKEFGDVEVVDYQVPLQFETGPAIIKVKLIADGKSYYIHHFGIHSEIFSESSQAN